MKHRKPLRKSQKGRGSIFTFFQSLFEKKKRKKKVISDIKSKQEKESFLSLRCKFAWLRGVMSARCGAPRGLRYF